MLINYRFSNVLSFNEAQCFTTEASIVRKHKERNYKLHDKEILRFSALYGKNASGKTCFVKTLWIMKNIVVYNAKEVIGKQLWHLYNSEDKDSVFEIEISINNKIFKYGFAINLKSGIVKEEWLLDITNSSEENFIYKFDKKSKKIDFNQEYLSKEVYEKIINSYYDDLISSNDQLILHQLCDIKSKSSFAKIKGSNIFFDIFNWFKDDLLIFSPNNSLFESIFSLLSESFVDDITSFLKEFDCGITKIELLENDLNEESESEIIVEIFNKRKANLKHLLEKTGKSFGLIGYKNYWVVKLIKGELKTYCVKFIHNDFKSHKFSFFQESDGTKRLIELSRIFLDNQKNKTFIIDELDRSMHPLLTIHFVEKFFKTPNNLKNQLIITTHESNLLDLDIIRRDEVWFLNLDKKSSELYSLEEFKVRFDKKIVDSYFDERYGGVPKFTKEYN